MRRTCCRSRRLSTRTRTWLESGPSGSARSAGFRRGHRRRVAIGSAITDTHLSPPSRTSATTTPSRPGRPGADHQTTPFPALPDKIAFQTSGRTYTGAAAGPHGGYSALPQQPQAGLLAWTGPWTDVRRNPSVMCAAGQVTCGFVARQAHVAAERASFNPLVQGSTP